MRIWLLILAGLWSVPASAVTNSASFLAQSASLSLDGVRGNDPSPFNRTVDTLFTTYDGSGTSVPLHGNGYGVSGELRPRAGETGVFETDYLTFSGGDLIEYGLMLFTLPTNDADTNGVPDFLQRDSTVNASFSAYGKMDFPGTSSFTASGFLRRTGGTMRGTYDLSVSAAGRVINYGAGYWHLLRISGTLEYSRETQNRLRLNLSLTNGNGSFATLTNSVIYSTPNANQLVLPQLALTRNASQKIILAPMTLTRSGHRYLGNAAAADGNLATAWADFTRFAIEIVDDNDSNTNGVPDLTDPTEAPDIILPRVAFTTPANNARVTNALLTVRGTASDNVGVARVEVAVGTHAFQAATGTNTWSATVPLEVGTNLVIAIAYDFRTNISDFKIRYFVRAPTSPLTLTNSGPGTFRPNLNGANLILGDRYTVTAVPAARHLFAGWTGGVETNVARLTFVMQSNLMLQASFVTNPFIAEKGTYLGLFSDTNQPLHESSGVFKATVAERGTFTSSLRISGRSYPLSGQFDLEGKCTKAIKFQRTNLLTATLCLDLTNGTHQITGQFETSNWIAQVLAYRPPVFGRTNPVPFAGRYTMNILAGTNSPSPAGAGVTSILVKSNGSMSLSGILGDGSRAAQTAPVSRDGRWPFYLSLYAGKGSLSGWLMFTNDVADSLVGQLNWFKPAVPRDRLYRDGFTNTAYAYGSTYSATVMTNLLATQTNACLYVSGLLPEMQTNCLTLVTKRTYGGPGVKALKLDQPTGLWTGSYTNPATGRPLPLKCTLLQQRGYGYGYVLGTNLSAIVSLVPGP